MYPKPGNTGKNMKNSKILNKPFYLDTLTKKAYSRFADIPLSAKDRTQRWGSILEYRTYQHIAELFPNHSIDRQHRISILPPSECFPALDWLIDFRIELDASRYLYLEVKGSWLKRHDGHMSSFGKLLRLLSEFQPEIFDLTYVVSDKKWKINGTKFVTVPIKKMIEIKEEVL